MKRFGRVEYSPLHPMPARASAREETASSVTKIDRRRENHNLSARNNAPDATRHHTVQYQA